MTSSEPRGRRSTELAVAAMAAQSVFLGYNWVVMKQGLQYADAWSFAALRTGLGAIALFLLLVGMRRPLRPQQLALTALLGLLQTAGMTGLLMWALETGAASRTGTLAYTMPFWTLILGWVFLKERIRGLQWLAVVLSLAGLVLVLDPMHLGGSLQSKILAVGTGICWAASAIVAKHINRRGSVDIINLTAWQMLLGTIPLVVVAFAVPTAPIAWTGGFLLALAYNVIPATAIAWALWLYVVRALPIAVAGISTLATPVIGITAAALQLGERVPLQEAVGMGLIIAALLVLTLGGLLGRLDARRPKEVAAASSAE